MNYRDYMESQDYNGRGYRVYVENPGFFYVRRIGRRMWTWVELTQAGEYKAGYSCYWETRREAVEALLNSIW